MAHKFRTGDARPSQGIAEARFSRHTGMAALALACIALLVTGCGGAEGVGEGARVTAYVEAPLCAGAERELARHGSRAGTIRVRAVCLPSSRGDGGLDLATIGANARRAAEDASAIVYLAAPDPAAARFSRPVLESAGIPRLADPSGATAMKQLLTAVRRVGNAPNVREAVSEDLMTR
jgi:hypothetical protein